MAEKVTYFARTTSGLVRSVSAWDALVHNVVFMAPMAIMVYGIWASQLFRGVNLPATALLCIPIAIICAIFYALFGAAMPRSGGDYMFVSRVIHPAVGFATSFFLFAVVLLVAGAYIPWFTRWGIAPIFNRLGWGGAAALISTEWMIFIISIVIYLLCGLIVSRGAKATMYAFWVLFSLILVGFLTFIITTLAVGPAGFQAKFNALSGMNYQAVLATAQGAGFPLHFTVGATLLGLVFTYINFLGFHASVYFGGEVKKVEKSQFIAIIGAVIVFSLITWGAYAAAYHTMGGLFLGAISFLSATGDPSYILPYDTPFIHFLYEYVAPNTANYIVMLFGWSMMTLAATLTYFFIAVRLIFTWSFDRVLPTKLSAVDRRYNAPYAAVIAVVVVTMIAQALWLYTPLLKYFAYIIFGWMIMQGITAIAGIAYPYRRPDLFALAPAIVKKRVGPLPLLVVFAIPTLIVSIGLGYANVMPAFVGVINPAVLVFTLGIFATGAIIYFISAAYHKRKERIPLAFTFKELPPE